jgi:hypothetical protein
MPIDTRVSVGCGTRATVTLSDGDHQKTMALSAQVVQSASSAIDERWVAVGEGSLAATPSVEAGAAAADGDAAPDEALDHASDVGVAVRRGLAGLGTGHGIGHEEDPHLTVSELGECGSRAQPVVGAFVAQGASLRMSSVFMARG